MRRPEEAFNPILVRIEVMSTMLDICTGVDPPFIALTYIGLMHRLGRASDELLKRFEGD